MNQRRRSDSAFTLVELMIVVAIIGILAAIAIPAFSRYIKKTRTAEAAGTLNKMWSGSVAYYESDHMTAGQTILPKQFPANTGWRNYQNASPHCGCRVGGKCAGGESNLVTDPERVYPAALNLALADPYNYIPSYQSAGTGNAAIFTAAVSGDLDCDSTIAVFQRVGSIDTRTNDVTGGSAPYVQNELE